MKNLFLFTFLFIGMFVITSAQTGVTLKFSPKDNRVFTKENNLFSAPLQISGISSDAELSTFKTKMKSNSIVNYFETSPKVGNDYPAILKLTTTDKNLIVPLLESLNVTTLIVKNKSYTLAQYDQISKDLKPVVEKQKTVSGN